MKLLHSLYGVLVIIPKFHLVRWLMFQHIGEWSLVSRHVFRSSTIHKPIIASMWDSVIKCWYYHILFISIILLSSEYFVSCFMIFDNMSMVSLFLDGTISYKVSIFITSIALNIGRISLDILLFLVLLVVMMVLLLLAVIPSVNCDTWYSVSPIFSSLVTSQDSSCLHSSWIRLKEIIFLLAQIP